MRCLQTFRPRSGGRLVEPKGLGTTWEAHMISQAEVIKVARAMLDQPLIGSQLRQKTENEYQAVSLARIHLEK